MKKFLSCAITLAALGSSSPVLANGNAPSALAAAWNGSWAGDGTLVDATAFRPGVSCDGKTEGQNFEACAITLQNFEVTDTQLSIDLNYDCKQFTGQPGGGVFFPHFVQYEIRNGQLFFHDKAVGEITPDHIALIDVFWNTGEGGIHRNIFQNVKMVKTGGDDMAFAFGETMGADPTTRHNQYYRVVQGTLKRRGAR